MHERGEDFYLLPFFSNERYGDLLLHFAAARCYIETSLHEAFGMQQLEALACGTPCLSTCAGALGEIAGGHSHCFDPNDTASAAARLAELCAGPFDEEARQARRDYCRRFTWERTVSVVADSLMQTALEAGLSQSAQG